MAIVINGQTGIDAGHLPISNAGNTEVEGTFTGADATVNSITANSVMTQGQNVTPFSGFKNYIINGNFDVDQYGRGSQQNWFSIYCYTDRFLVFNSSTVVRNGSGSSNPTGFTNHLSVTKTAVADTQIIQRWEIPKDKAKMFLNGRTLTFSCWVLSDVNNFIEDILFIKQGTTVNAYEVKTFSITKNNTLHTWTRITATISNIQWTYEVGDYIEIRLDLLGSTAGTIHTTGWQLEEGSVATPFEQRPYGLELSLCQRYYEHNLFKHYIPNSGASSIITSIPYKVTKRVAASLTYSSVGIFGGYNPPVDNDSVNNENGFNVVRNTDELNFHWYASAEL